MLIDNNNNILFYELDTKNIVNLVFADSPKLPCTYQIALSEEAYLNNVTLFQLLMNILICGAKKLYGEYITANEITKQEFDELKKYMISMGYVIKYNYTYNDDNIATKINIWFEPYIHETICNGKMFLK
jgi:hypothetical protein